MAGLVSFLRRKWVAVWVLSGLTTLISLAVVDYGKALDVFKAAIDPLAGLAGALMVAHKVSDTYAAGRGVATSVSRSVTTMKTETPAKAPEAGGE